jgi:signal peptidase I
MYPTLHDGYVMLLDEIYYKFDKLDRFDIVVIKYKDSSGKSELIIKRVIGLPGDKIEYKDNILYVNDEAIEEKFLSDDVVTNDFNVSDLGYEVIPDDMYLVLGDNREDSLDSRDIGLITKKDILGKVNIRIWPINKIRYVK